MFVIIIQSFYEKNTNFQCFYIIHDTDLYNLSHFANNSIQAVLEPKKNRLQQQNNLNNWCFIRHRGILSL